MRDCPVCGKANLGSPAYCDCGYEFYREEPPPPMPGSGGPGLPGWLEERLFDQRIVMLRGPLTGEAASGVAAALLTLDAAGPAPVQLHVASTGGELGAAHAVIDIIDAMAAPVHAVVTSEAGGAKCSAMLGDEMIDEASRKMALVIAGKGRAAGMTRGERWTPPES